MGRGAKSIIEADKGRERERKREEEGRGEERRGEERREEKRSCLLYTSPSPRDLSGSRMPSSA
jgi:hypothetical protein